MSAEDKFKKIFSERLNNYLMLRNKTQSDIVNDLKINKSAISSWCNGTRLPRMNKIELLANYLGISVSDLINEDPSNTMTHICTDESMFPLLGKGDIATIDKTNNIENGFTYLISYNNSLIVRKILLEDGIYTLKAMNPYFPDIIIDLKTTNNFRVIGKVIKAENQSAFK